MDVGDIPFDATPDTDLSEAAAQARRDIRKRLIDCGDEQLKDAFYSALTLVEELEARGYDLTTLKLSIKQKS